MLADNRLDGINSTHVGERDVRVFNYFGGVHLPQLATLTKWEGEKKVTFLCLTSDLSPVMLSQVHFKSEQLKSGDNGRPCSASTLMVPA